ncbi:cysteine protease atg4da-like isoform X1 [Osmerus mordax]|uniref:cysteine protease atg4da-like isoform X1 n=1 Tax=Osmerus mordax TaxID=8014 RepID=UPI00350E94BF
MDTPRSSPSQDPCPEEDEEDEDWFHLSSSSLGPQPPPCSSGSSSHEEQDEDWFHLSSSSLGPPPPPCSSGSSSHEEQEEQQEERGRLRTRLFSTLNNVKYGWWFRSMSRFSQSSPVIMLGQSYLLSTGAERKRFHRAFSSLLWLTYRRGFPPLRGLSHTHSSHTHSSHTHTSDSGWGCMLRSAQMLLAQGLMLHLRGAQSEPGESPCPSPGPGPGLAQRVVSWLGDHPGAPLGLHLLVRAGQAAGRRAGDWYGPGLAGHILRKAVAASVEVAPHLVVYVAQDCTVYKGDVLSLVEVCVSGDSQGEVPVAASRGILILVPGLLGLQCCVGIMGGKPRHSLYFVGYQGDKLLYLDPHYCQSAVDTTQPGFSLKSFHCSRPMKMSFCRMDPSCTVGFYARGAENVEAVCSAVNTVLSSFTETYPMFTFAEGHAQEEDEEGGRAVLNHARLNSTSSRDEFVLL